MPKNNNPMFSSTSPSRGNQPVMPHFQARDNTMNVPFIVLKTFIIIQENTSHTPLST
jgi:hypothetical protein